MTHPLVASWRGAFAMAVVSPYRSSIHHSEDRTAAGTELDEVVAALFPRMAAEPAERPQLRARMIEVALPFAIRLARHYQGRGEPFEDLVQVAAVGLIKAIDGYDPERGPFSHYAMPTVRGELRKHFRDRGWSIRVPRRLQELKMDMARVHQELTQVLGRAPTVAEIAGYLEVDEDQVLEGMELAHAYQPVSLDAPVSGQDDSIDLAATLGARDPAVENADDRMTLAGLVPRLPEREQRILHMRFSGNMTQSQIAAEIGISQMHVSRLLAQTLGWLRAAMTGEIEPVWPGLAGAAAAPEPGALHLAIQRLAGGTVVVEVGGEVDADNVDVLRTALCETALSDRPRRIRVDLAQVPLIDAAGMNTLVAGFQAAHHCGADLRLEHLRPAVARMLCAAGLAELAYPRRGDRSSTTSVAQTTLPS
jgi:RNA polymerase sigma-B factor